MIRAAGVFQSCRGCWGSASPQSGGDQHEHQRGNFIQFVDFRWLPLPRSDLITIPLKPSRARVVAEEGFGDMSSQ